MTTTTEWTTVHWTVNYIGDSSHKNKNWYREKYLDFLEEPDDSTRRTQPGGIYHSYYADTQGKIKIILLDIHFSRKGEDDLGPDQREWLLQEIADGRPEVFLLVSGSPMIATDRIAGDSVSRFTRRYIFGLINQR